MIFNKMKVLFAATALVAIGFAPTAFATSADDCSIGCGTSTNSGLSLNVLGSAGIGGNVGSMFKGDSGSNLVKKYGETHTDVQSSLSGLCSDGKCGNTTIKMDLMAKEGGSALTHADGSHSGTQAEVQNSGLFTSGVSGTIDFGGKTTNLGTQGAAGFANQAMTKATGGHVENTMKSYGSGETVSNLKSGGDACASCADFTGGSHAKAASGMDMTSMATGGKSGQMIGIKNSGLSESATSMNSMFNKSNN